MNKLIGFLLGENEYDGVWFSENHPGKPSFWWRKELRKAIAQETQKAEVSGRVDEVKRISATNRGEVLGYKRDRIAELQSGSGE